MGIDIIQGGQGKSIKVSQCVVLYVKSDNSVQAELVLNEKVIDTSNFSVIIILSEVDNNGNYFN